MKKIFTAVFAFTTIFLSQAQIKNDTIGLEPTLIQAFNKRPLRLAPVAVAQVDSLAIAQSDPVQFAQILQTVPGVSAQQGARNTLRISLRGIGSRSQYSTNRIKAYYGQIPLTTGDGETTLEDIDLLNIAGVEIIKGPNSSIYGAGLGGAILLQPTALPESTFKDDDRSAFAPRQARHKLPFGKAFSTSGSFDLWRYGIVAGYQEQNSQTFASYSKTDLDGYRQNSAYRRDNVFVDQAWRINDRHSIQALVSYTNLKAYIPSSITRQQLEEDPAAAAFTWRNARGFESYKKLVAGITHEHQISGSKNGRLKLSNTVFMHTRDAYEPRPFNILTEDRFTLGYRGLLTGNELIAGRKTEYRLGVELLSEDYSAQTYQNLYEDFPDRGSVLGNILSNNEQDRSYTNVFASFSHYLTERMIIDAGLNLGTTRYELEDRFAQDGINQSGDYRYDPILSPRISLLFDLNKTQSFFATASHGYSVPGVEETLTPEGRINTDLQPETGWNFEVGYRYFSQQSPFRFEVNVYTIQIENLLIARRIDNDQFVGINAGSTDHTGIEISSLLPIINKSNNKLNLNLAGNYNLHRFDEFVEQGIDFSGNELTNVPEYEYSTLLNYNWRDRLFLNINTLGVGPVPVDDANSDYTDAYLVSHFQGSYQLGLTKHWNLSINAGVNNLFNKAYVASIVPNAVGFGSNAPRNFYPSEKRNWFAGMSVAWNLN
ncbi:hypothetical protein BST97_01670 [Nonlabens spongiae]|uniref:TonB-dependent receptor n=1 Tax=Nonlabens spongiae TaxID=331648 RepID=A0A1W6MH56_9FLAO|nr:TonB-dependent receptor [Nonlabens spongiae]ARN76809.1 hypothetical protein BST97_01670 [Nonlabens spongiae]